MANAPQSFDRSSGPNARTAFRTLTIVLAGYDPAWISLLDSEGFAWRLLSDGCSHPNGFEVLVVPRCANAHNRATCQELLARGASVIADCGIPGLESASVRETVTFPFHPSNFAGVRGAADGPSSEVTISSLGLGKIYTLPIRLGTYWTSRSVGKNSVVVEPESETCVWHYQAEICKRNVRRLVVEVVRRAFTDRGLPLVRKWYWPGRNRSVFCLRGDLDGGPSENLSQFLDCVRPFSHAVALFVCGKEYRSKTDLIRQARDCGIEIGNHSYSHFVFPEAPSNRRDLRLAIDVLSACGCRAHGFAGPAHFWHPSLYPILATAGYRYASCFGLDHDHLPYWPVLNGRLAPLLEIPYHCVGDFFSKFGMELGGPRVRTFFASLIDKKIRAAEPLFLYGHPDVPSRLGAHTRLVSFLLEQVMSYSDVWACHLSELANWWVQRAEVRYEPYFDEKTQRVVCDLDDSAKSERAWSLAVQMPDGSWHLASAPATAHWEISPGHETKMPAVTLPSAGDVGEVVCVQEPTSFRQTLRRTKRELKRLGKKYWALYCFGKSAR